MGEKVSYDKSSFFFSGNTPIELRKHISYSINILEVSHLGTDLGILIVHSRVSKELYDLLLLKIDKHLDGWKCNLLSLAGRVTLAKLVL